MMPAMRRALPLLLALTLTGCKANQQPQPNPPLRVAAAADLILAFEELGKAFEQTTKQPLTFTFGSTGLLAKQLRSGAPFDVFAAANESFVNDVVAAGVCDGSTKAPYARGRIAVWMAADAKNSHALKALEQLRDDHFVRIAIANPEHAPYGQAAKQALQSVGLWDTLSPRLVLGENVRQTLQFAQTGNVDAAIVALSLVIQDHDNPWLLLPESLHRPIDQALVVCNQGKNKLAGVAFTNFINSSAGREVMQRFGFLLPGERLTKSDEP